MVGYGTNNLISMGLRVYLKDEFSSQANAIKNSFGDMRKEISMYKDNLRASQSAFGGMALAGGYALHTMTQWAKVGADYDFVMRGIQASSEGTREQVEQLGDVFSKVSRVTGFAPTEIAEAGRQFTLAGMNMKDAAVAIGPAALLARSAMEPLGGKGGVAELMVNLMRHFDVPFDQAGIFADKLSRAAVKSSLNVSELGESLKYSASTAVDLGVSFDQATAVMMTLANAGIKGSMAGVVFENELRYLAKALGDLSKGKSTKGANALKSIGLGREDLVDAQGNLKDLGTILTMIHDHTKGMGNIDKQNILYELFNVRGKRGASLLDRNLSEFFKNLSLLENAKGSAQKANDVMMDGPKGALLRMKAAWEEFKNSFMYAVEPIFNVIVKSLTLVSDALTWVNKSWLGSWIVKASVLFIGLVTIISAARWAITTLALRVSTLNVSFTSMLASTKQGFIELITLAGFLNRGLNSVGGRLRYTAGTVINGVKVGGRFAPMAAAGGISAGAGAMGLLRGGGALLGLSNPIGWVITGISLLATLLPLFSSNSAAIKENTDQLKENQRTEEQKNQDREVLNHVFNKMVNSEGRRLYTIPGGGLNDTSLELYKELQKYKQNPKAYPGGQYYDFSKPSRVEFYIEGSLVKSMKFNAEKVIKESIPITTLVK